MCINTMILRDSFQIDIGPMHFNKCPNGICHAASKVFTEMEMTYSCQNNVAKEKQKLDFEAYYKTTLFKTDYDLGYKQTYRLMK